MRIVEPKTYKSKSGKKQRKSNKIIGVLLLLVVVSVVVIYLAMNRDSQNNDAAVEPETSEKIESTDKDEENIVSEVAVFSGNEFRLLYDNILLPNTKKINTPPVITGNDIADARIRTIAETRGYRIRTTATEVPTFFEGYRLQQDVRSSWKEMQREALSNGLNMTITSAYRAIEDQRVLFVSRLQAEGVNIQNVADGLADSEIDKVLVTTSIPGYSKHHSGYTIDLLCAGWIFENFQDSDCNKWLVANNYDNAKKYGFIPSYPIDADMQGPDPEAWEYVYVGMDSLIQ